ncbi:MAG: putative carboxyl-terminal protease [Candidatus Saccharibacteria bacterium]|nr:putative carboxyl-terminal protease [Candidatus Saccharibacteria bacterium]
MTDNKQPRARHARKSHIDKSSLSGFATLAIVGALAVGYLVGAFHTQVFAAIAPIFGQKTYSGTLDTSSLQTTYQQLKANYDGTVSDEALIAGANKGLVEAAGDNYTTYMTKSEVEAFDNSLSGNIGGGIGAEIGLKDKRVSIIRTLEDYPAKKAGLNAGDIIDKINGESTEGWTVDEAVSKIRGEAGTTVKLDVIRGTEMKSFTVTREIINAPSVSSQIVDNIGIITMSRFDSETANLAKTAADDFKAKNVKGIILDLRGDAGGYLVAAQQVAGLWLENKVVVSERTNGKVVEELKSGSFAPLKGIKTVVLVNGGSASASEIVAGALKDHGAATLIGEKTFGKGSVQKLLELPGGAQLKVTVARWYTPKGKNITEEGISPDQTVTLTQADIDAGNDPQLNAAKAELSK